LVLRGAIAATVTPLSTGGSEIDEEAIGPLVDFLSAGGLDGALVAGTTGEGLLLSAAERERVAERFLEARPIGFSIAVHAGAQTTADTVRLARHAAENGADAVAVIAPPFFPLDEVAAVAHLAAAADACAPLPFFVYEFAARSGYAVPVSAIERLRDRCANLAGLKVSDTPWEAVGPYLLEGLDVFVGQEPFALRALERGAVGTVSGLAAAFPELVAELVHGRSPTAHDAVVMLRDRLARVPFQAAMKAILVWRGMPLHHAVRPPLRVLWEDERELTLAVASSITAP
jgi:dihydrodipicolinate synthase/N-acetylneuraminate lyase